MWINVRTTWVWSLGNTFWNRGQYCGGLVYQSDSTVVCVNSYLLRRLYIFFNLQELNFFNSLPWSYVEGLYEPESIFCLNYCLSYKFVWKLLLHCKKKIRQEDAPSRRDCFGPSISLYYKLIYVWASSIPSPPLLMSESDLPHTYTWRTTTAYLFKLLLPCEDWKLSSDSLEEITVTLRNNT
jgi:hypothetical protein